MSFNNSELLKEILVNRYLLVRMLNKIDSIVDTIRERDELLNKIIPEVDKKRLENIRKQDEKMEFECFTISTKQYEALINFFGVEVVTDATVILDKYIRRTGKKYKSYYQRLKELCTRLSKQEKIKEELDDLIRQARQIHFSMIEDKQLAVAYIKSVPEYLQNIDEGCKYLKEKFEL